MASAAPPSSSIVRASVSTDAGGCVLARRRASSPRDAAGTVGFAFFFFQRGHLSPLSRSTGGPALRKRACHLRNRRATCSSRSSFDLFSFYENLLNVRLESRLAPIAARRALGELRLVYSRCLQQGTRRGQVEPRIFPVGKIVVPPRHLAFGIVSEKGL